MNETIPVRLKSMPVGQQIESSHGESQPSSEIMPAPVHHLFEMAYGGQHGEDSFNDHALVIGVTLTDLQIGWVILPGIEAMIGKNDRFLFKTGN